MIPKYIRYLKTIDKKLSGFFESQKPYIFCKEGCSFCCETGEYPYTLVEIQYLMLGFHQLAPEIQFEILEKINKLKEAKRTHKGKFMHECPFLTDKRCSVYNFRGLICRTHGLAFYDSKGKLRVPECIHQGLNYSNVYDTEKGVMSSELFKASGFETEPVSFNLSRKFLLNNEATQYLELDFGEEKALIDWL
ncbi:MAG: YkgJ family cysteine cluster protein [Heliobacteriaceae bacterium]|jgi:Fe-S-cluster containining protein|nr:YkgJ family cysteine cluster protein [Heliobacteriaceae bacterium]